MSQTVPLGRKIAVRLVPYGKPAAGVSVIACSGGGCPTDPTRFRDPVTARTTARAHVARHIHEFGEPAARARCRCGLSDCGWHPSRKVARCAGPTTLVLIPDATERVWVITETCADCAEAIPRSKILKGGRPPTVAPAPPETAERPSPAQAKQAAVEEAKAAERDRALNCPVCAAEAPIAPRPDPKDPAAREPRPVPTWYARAALDAFRHLELVHAGHTPEARLLALLITLRLRKDGTCLLKSCDFSPERLNLPSAALTELIDYAWAASSVEDICKAGPGDAPVVCHVPELVGGLGRLGIASSARSHINAWALAVTSHPSLVNQPAGIRLGAFYATAHCNSTGQAAIYPRHMAKLCRYTSRELVLPALEALAAAQWLRPVRPGPRSGDPISITLNGPARCFAPGYAPARSSSTTATSPRQDTIAVHGRGYEIAAWVDAYVARHRHGPRHHELIAIHFKEDPLAPWTAQTIMSAIRRLADDGWLRTDGNRWYRTRPGMTYLRRLAREQSAQPVPPTSGVRSDRVSSPRRYAAADSKQPPGLWLLPGAEAVLGTRYQ